MPNPTLYNQFHKHIFALSMSKTNNLMSIFIFHELFRETLINFKEFTVVDVSRLQMLLVVIKF